MAEAQARVSARSSSNPDRRKSCRSIDPPLLKITPQSCKKGLTGFYFACNIFLNPIRKGKRYGTTKANHLHSSSHLDSVLSVVWESVAEREVSGRSTKGVTLV